MRPRLLDASTWQISKSDVASLILSAASMMSFFVRLLSIVLSGLCDWWTCTYFCVFGWDSISCLDVLLCFLRIRVFGLTKLGRRNEGCFPSHGPLQGANRSSVWWKWKALWMMNPICPLQIDDVSFVFACFLRRWWFEGALPFESRKLPATG